MPPPLIYALTVAFSIILLPNRSLQIDVVKSTQQNQGITISINGDEYKLPSYGTESDEIKSNFTCKNVKTSAKTYDRYALRSDDDQDRIIDYIKLGQYTIKPSQNEVIKQIWNVAKPSTTIEVYLNVSGSRKLELVSFEFKNGKYGVPQSKNVEINILKEGQAVHDVQTESTDTDVGGNEESTQSADEPHSDEDSQVKDVGQQTVQIVEVPQTEQVEQVQVQDVQVQSVQVEEPEKQEQPELTEQHDEPVQSVQPVQPVQLEESEEPEHTEHSEPIQIESVQQPANEIQLDTVQEVEQVEEVMQIPSTQPVQIEQPEPVQPQQAQTPVQLGDSDEPDQPVQSVQPAQPIQQPTQPVSVPQQQSQEQSVPVTSPVNISDSTVKPSSQKPQTTNTPSLRANSNQSVQIQPQPVTHIQQESQKSVPNQSKSAPPVPPRRATPPNVGAITLDLDSVDGMDSRISSTFKNDAEVFSVGDNSSRIGVVKCGLLTVKPLTNEVGRQVSLEYVGDDRQLTIECSLKDGGKVSKVFKVTSDAVHYDNDNVWTNFVTVSNGDNLSQSMSDTTESTPDTTVSIPDNTTNGTTLDISNSSRLYDIMKNRNFGSVSCYYSTDSNINTINIGKDILHDRIMAKEIHVCMKNFPNKKLVRLSLLSLDGTHWKVLYYSVSRRWDNGRFVQDIQEIPVEPSFAHITYSSNYLDASTLDTSQLIDAPVLETDVWDLWPDSVLNLEKFPLPPGVINRSNSKDNKNVSFYYISRDQFESNAIKVLKFGSFDYSVIDNFKIYHVEVLFAPKNRSLILFKTDGVSTAFEVYRENTPKIFSLINDAYKSDEYVIDHPGVADAMYKIGKPRGRILDVLNNTSIGSEPLCDMYNFKKVGNNMIYLFVNDSPEMKIRFGPNEITLQQEILNKRVIVFPSATEDGVSTVTYQFVRDNKLVILTYQLSGHSGERVYNLIKPREPLGYTITNSTGSYGQKNSTVKYFYSTSTFLNNTFKTPIGKYITRVDLNMNGKNMPQQISKVTPEEGQGSFRSSSGNFVIGNFIAGNIHVSTKPGETSKRVDYKIVNGIKEFNIISIVNWSVVQQKFIETNSNSGIFTAQ